MKTRKTPLRMCVGCREMKDKRELIRVVRSPEGEISLDPTGKRQAAELTYAERASASGERSNSGSWSGSCSPP